MALVPYGTAIFARGPPTPGVRHSLFVAWAGDGREDQRATMVVGLRWQGLNFVLFFIGFVRAGRPVACLWKWISRDCWG